MFGTLEKSSKSVKIWYQDANVMERPDEDEIFYRRYNSSELSIFRLPNHKSEIQRFKWLPQICNQKDLQPAALLTICNRQALLWVEQIDCTEMAFSCMHDFRIGSDATFI
jgi:hypothetical protein